MVVQYVPITRGRKAGRHQLPRAVKMNATRVGTQWHGVHPDMTHWRHNISSVVCFAKITQSPADNPKFYAITSHGYSEASTLWKTERDLKNWFKWECFRGHDDQMQYGILHRTLEKKNSISGETDKNLNAFYASGHSIITPRWILYWTLMLQFYNALTFGRSEWGYMGIL